MLFNIPGLSPAQKIRLAHDEVFRRHPMVLASVAARWKIVVDESEQTFCTNGKELRYNPAWCDGLTLGQVACVILHEISHVALGHHFRLARVLGVKMVGPQHRGALARFNVAADLAINSRLMPEFVDICPRPELEQLLNQICVPRRGKFAELPEGKSAEWYYQELNKAAQERQEAQRKQAEEERQKAAQQQPPQSQPQPKADDKADKGKDEAKADKPQKAKAPKAKDEDGAGDDEDDDAPGSGGGDDSDDEGDDADTGSGAGDEGDEDGEGEGDGDGDGDGEGEGEGGGKGSGRGDGDGDYGDFDEEAEGMPGNAFGKLEPFDTEPEAVEEGEKDFERGVTAAIITSKSWGVKGGWLETELTDAVYRTDPDAEKFNWRGALREFLNRVCRQGFTYTRPSRRHGYRQDVILPAHRGRGNTHGLLIVDTSGSMGDAECNIALRELESILGEFPRASVKMISCDTKVIDGPTYTRNDFPIREAITWKGRGGTNLAPAFQWAAEQRKGTFDWCVILTDMEWYWQKAPNPGVPTIWLGCLSRPEWSPQAKGIAVPFGHYVEVKV